MIFTPFVLRQFQILEDLGWWEMTANGAMGLAVVNTLRPNQTKR